MSEIDVTNPQVEQIMAIPPALLEAIHNGELDALSATARVQLAYLMEKATIRCATDASVSPSATASIMEVLRKISASGKDVSDSDGGPQVVINITRRKDSDDAITIEGSSKPAIEA